MTAHVMEIEDGPRGRVVKCACGWVATHKRGKVLAEKARRHYAKNGIYVDESRVTEAPPMKPCDPPPCPPIEETTL